MKKRKAYTESHIRAQRKYNSANIVQVSFKVNRKTEPDILKKLESVENKQGYIKQLIREDIERMKED